MDIKDYQFLLTDIKARIRNAQTKAALAINAELIILYWDIGKTINELQNKQGWGATVTARLANDIKNELPELKGFSERNLKFMGQFYKEHNSDEVASTNFGRLPACPFCSSLTRCLSNK